MDKVGVLLINLGTPESAEPHHVKSYLKEFLMDPLVVDIAYPLRWLLVNQIILRTRPKMSAALYKKIWTEKGSPLLFHTLTLAEEVQKELGDPFVVVPAMRYGQPSIKEGLNKLKHNKVKRILALPLYPQYSLAASQSSIDECVRVLKEMVWDVDVKFYPAFYEHTHFVGPFKDLVKEVWLEKKPEMLIFSFHGVPERHVKKTDATGKTCLASDNCCDQIRENNKNCYRAQCFATARAIAKELHLAPEKYRVSFQSRLGRTPWIKPYTDILYDELAKKGIKRIAVVCPSFVADCLETLEEVAIRGKEQYLKAGGEELHFVPSLNSTPRWVKALSHIVKENA